MRRLEERLQSYIERSIKTKNLPIYFSTLETLVIYKEDWRNIGRDPEMLRFITSVASVFNLVFSEEKNSWDFPAVQSVQEELPRDRTIFEPKLKPPTHIKVAVLPKVHNNNHSGRNSDGEYDDSGRY